ncbi:MAG: molecular chaperone HtpG, partial [Defluviicoccus sp.]|nr:molecular chaperone HtpG [Defluviicoccus sp.]
MAEETLSFQTEVSRLLRIVANSLYSEKRIFMRELISNASDACDRLRYEALAEPGLIEDDPEFRVRIELDAEARTVSVVDNGIGMNREGLIADLGTI